MPVVISSALVLSEDVAGGPNAPLIGWHNLVTATGITADEEAAFYPATNLGNPSTALRWQGETTDEQTIIFDIAGSDPIDYVGIARHNLGSGQVAVSLEIPDEDNPGDWIEIMAEAIPASDHALVLHFEEVTVAQVKLRLQPSATIPRIAVVYIGQLLRLPRGVQPGLVPTIWAASDDVISAESESGDYLGQIVLRRSLATAVTVKYLDYDWWNASMAGFVTHARARQPFFFAWLPEEYPDDVGYAWATNDIRPEAERVFAGVVVHFSLDLKAVAL